MTEKLIIIEKKYKIRPYIESLDMSPRGQVENTIRGSILDEVGASTVLKSGTRIDLTEDGAIINNYINMDISPTRRTGGCLISKYTSLNIRPADKIYANKK